MGFMLVCWSLFSKKIIFIGLNGFIQSAASSPSGTASELSSRSSGDISFIFMLKPNCLSSFLHETGKFDLDVRVQFAPSDAASSVVMWFRHLCWAVDLKFWLYGNLVFSMHGMVVYRSLRDSAQHFPPSMRVTGLVRV